MILEFEQDFSRFSLVKINILTDRFEVLFFNCYLIRTFGEVVCRFNTETFRVVVSSLSLRVDERRVSGMSGQRNN